VAISTSPDPQTPPIQSPLTGTPGRLVIAACLGAVIPLSLLIIVAVCFQLTKGIEHPIIEALLLAAIVVWASFSIATSNNALLISTATYAAMVNCPDFLEGCFV